MIEFLMGRFKPKSWTFDRTVKFCSSYLKYVWFRFEAYLFVGIILGISTVTIPILEAIFLTMVVWV